MEAPEVGVLAQHENIIGIKESSGHVQRIAEMVAATRSNFAVLTGGGGVVLPSVIVGAKGAILAAASALPERYVELYALTRQGQLEKARELQLALLQISKAFGSESGIAGIKFVMDQRGYRGGLCRPPLLPISEALQRKLLDLLAAVEPVAARA